MKLSFIAVFLTFIFCVNKINSTIENGKSENVDTLISWPNDIPGLSDCFSKYAYDDCSNRMNCCEKHHSTMCTC
ncbi:hypothetical protein ACQ4LE_009888 [Meloidogyne hapla]